MLDQNTLTRIALLKVAISDHIRLYSSILDYLEESITVITEKEHQIGLKHHPEAVSSAKDKHAWRAAYLDYWNDFGSHAQIIRHSYLISIFSFLESALHRVCQRVVESRKKYGITIRLNDIKGSSLDRVKIYLRKIGNCNEDLFGKHTTWNDVRRLQDVRDLCVHSDGLIQEDNKNKDLRAYIESHKDLLSIGRVASVERIIVKDAYCSQSLTNIEDFLNQVLDEVTRKL